MYISQYTVFIYELTQNRIHKWYVLMTAINFRFKLLYGLN